MLITLLQIRLSPLGTSKEEFIYILKETLAIFSGGFLLLLFYTLFPYLCTLHERKGIIYSVGTRIY
jgi:hypothetical protein